MPLIPPPTPISLLRSFHFLVVFSFLIATAINRKLASQSSSEVCGGISRNKEKYSSCLSFCASTRRFVSRQPGPHPLSKKNCSFHKRLPFLLSLRAAASLSYPRAEPVPFLPPGRSNNFIYKQRRLHRCLSVARDLLRAPGAQSKLANSFPARNFHARLATRYE